jgi:uncharacterized protein (DUF433 family)
MMESDLLNAKWLLPLREAFEVEFAAASEAVSRQRPQWEQDRRELEARRGGLLKSLGDPGLDPKVRDLIQTDLSRAVEQIEELDIMLKEADAATLPVDELFELPAAVDRLNRLVETLRAGDATAINLELAGHLDRIDCFVDGSVATRICKLGAFPAALNALLIKYEAVEPQVFAETHATPSDSATVPGPATPRSRARRRAKLRTDPFAADAVEQKDAAHFAADPNRFGGLPASWFWEERASVPEKTCWASDNAAEVARMRATGLTMEALARHFERTVPTIRKALRLAARTDVAVQSLPKKMPRPRWAIDHAEEVARLKRQGMSTADLAAHFNKSDTTIREALVHAERQKPAE